MIVETQKIMMPAELKSTIFVSSLAPLPLLSSKETERYLRIKSRQLDSTRHRNIGIPYFRIGKTIKYAIPDLEIYEKYFKGAAQIPAYIDNPFADLLGHGLLLDPTAAGKFLTVKRGRLCELRQRGVGPRFCRLGHLIRYPVDELLHWLISCRMTPITNRKFKLLE